MTPLLVIAVLVGSLFLGAPGIAQTAPPHARIGWLSFNTSEANAPLLAAFKHSLNELGYAEGRNLTVLTRYADNKPDQVARLARDLADAKVDLLIPTGAATRDTLATIRNVPIVYAFSGDPVAAGFATSLATPKEGTTGLTWLSIELNGKRIQLLKEAVPSLRRLAILANPLHPGEDMEIAECRRAADALGLSLTYLPVRTVPELEDALKRIGEEGIEAVIALPDVLIMGQRSRIIEFAAERRIPVVSGWGLFAHSGGLLTYGPNFVQSYRRLAGYAHRVLSGTKPSTLPIEQPTSFELVVNLGMARRLGIDLAPAFLARADEVIE